MKRLIFASISLTLFALAMPAYADSEETEAKDVAEEKVCINSNRVRNFDGLTDEYLFVEETGKKYYLLTLRHRCSGLRNANGIAFKDTTSRICTGGFGEVIFRNRGIGPEKCGIDKVERVENKDEARAIVAEREHYQKEKAKMEKQAKKKAKGTE